MTMRQRYTAPPALHFNCTLVYQTPGGSRSYYRTKTTAPNEDAALDLAEKMLRRDKLRKCARINYAEAIEQ